METHTVSIVILVDLAILVYQQLSCRYARGMQLKTLKAFDTGFWHIYLIVAQYNHSHFRTKVLKFLEFITNKNNESKREFILKIRTQ